MRISLNWLRQYVDVHETPAELARMLTLAGLEVSCVETLGEGISGVVVARIESKGPHPDADRLSLCRVTDGTQTYDIVCGATNMVAGDRVALARIGAELPGGFKIKKTKIRGQTSEGMMCSRRELGLADDHAGLLILPETAPLGERLLDVLGLPDTVIEVEITPNRPDWLSVCGVAREIAALTGRELKLPEPRVPENDTEAASLTSVTIEAPDLCHRYAARLIRGVKIGPSPLWMQARLTAAGVRPISNAVDVTNYVLMELGHPLHAFDFNKLRGRRIVVKRAGDGEKFTTLDNSERALDTQNLMIADGEGSVAVAGIMGGLNSEVDDATQDILLESAYFSPAGIRRTAKQLGLRTEASYRFERGADIDGLIRALERAAQLIVELAGGSACRGIVDAYPTRAVARRVTLRLAKATSVLGVEIAAAEAEKLLTGLGLRVVESAAGHLVVEIPAFRVDLEREIDLIEEVVRLRGFDTIPETLPKIAMTAERSEPTGGSLPDRTRDALAASGFQEIITLSFIDPADDDRIALRADSPLRAKVEIQNPLGRETSVLRTSLLPGLLRVASTNARRGKRDLRVFEVGRTFHPDCAEQLPVETMRAAAVLTGRRNPLAWWAGAEKADFFDGKGVLENVLTTLGVRDIRFAAASDIEWLQPGRAASFAAGGKTLGWIGEILPDLLGAYELVAPVVAFQFDLDAVADAASEVGAFPGLAKFPAMERDIALLVDRAVSTQALIDAVAELKLDLVKSVVLFDAFEGGKLPEGKQSLALRITYQSDERTLTEEEVSGVEASIVKKLAENHGARLRDI
jgi:phenylalanyl-tRNA synthetase beta chain